MFLKLVLNFEAALFSLTKDENLVILYNSMVRIGRLWQGSQGSQPPLWVSSFLTPEELLSSKS